MLLSTLFLLLAVICITKLVRWHARCVAEQEATPNTGPEGSASSDPDNRSLGGGIVDGIRQVVVSPYLLGICLLMLLFTSLATFLYIQQAELVKTGFADRGERTAVFAFIDLMVNGLTLLLQTVITARLIRRFGLARTLSLIPILLAIGFVVLALQPTLVVLIVVQVIRRAGNYAIMRPSREMLYVVLRREEKYKAKNFIDTVVYRGGDAVSAWLYSGLRGLGLSISSVAAIAVPAAVAMSVLAYSLGRKQTRLAQTGQTSEEKPVQT